MYILIHEGETSEGREAWRRDINKDFLVLYRVE